MIKINATKTGRINLGKQGENLSRMILFDEPVAWAREFGKGTVHLIVQPPGQSVPYSVILSEENGHFVWTLTRADTAAPGSGFCELCYKVGDMVVKSSIYSTFLAKGLEASMDGPVEPYLGYLEQIIQAGTDAVEAARQAKASAANPPKLSENNTWMVWDVEEKGYVDTLVSAAGPQGEQGPAGPQGPKGEAGTPGMAEEDVRAAIDIAITGAIEEVYYGT